MAKFLYVGDFPGTRSGETVEPTLTPTGLRLRWGRFFNRRERRVSFEWILDARIFTGAEISRGQRGSITDFRAAWVLDAHYLLIRLRRDAGVAAFALRGEDAALQPLARAIRDRAPVVDSSP